MAELAFQLIDSKDVTNHNEFALEVAKLLTIFFPESSNAFEAYAEILAKTGKKAEAISMYKKSIALNPQNEDAKMALEELLKK